MVYEIGAFTGKKIPALSETTFSERVGAEMRASRKAAGLTLRSLASAMKRPITTVVQWENGTTTSLNNIERYAQVVGVPVATFFVRAAPLPEARIDEQYEPLWEKEALAEADLEAIGRHVMHPNE